MARDWPVVRIFHCCIDNDFVITSFVCVVYDAAFVMCLLENHLLCSSNAATECVMHKLCTIHIPHNVHKQSYTTALPFHPVFGVGMFGLGKFRDFSWINMNNVWILNSGYQHWRGNAAVLASIPILKSSHRKKHCSTFNVFDRFYGVDKPCMLFSSLPPFALDFLSTAMQLPYEYQYDSIRINNATFNCMHKLLFHFDVWYCVIRCIWHHFQFLNMLIHMFVAVQQIGQANYFSCTESCN